MKTFVTYLVAFTKQLGDFWATLYNSACSQYNRQSGEYAAFRNLQRQSSISNRVSDITLRFCICIQDVLGSNID